MINNKKRKSNEDIISFELSTIPTLSKAVDSSNDASNSNAVWRDEDDSNVLSNLNFTDRLKKLKKINRNKLGNNGDEVKRNGIVDGNELSSLLAERYHQQKQLAWINVDEENNSKDKILSNASKLTTSNKQTINPLTAGKISITRCTDANIAEKAENNAKITSIHFHPINTRMVLVGSEDKFIRLYNIDEERNEKIMSVRISDMAVKFSKFLGHYSTYCSSGITTDMNSCNNNGSTISEIIIAGRKPYMYSYDIAKGAISKITALMNKGIKSNELIAITPSVISTQTNAGATSSAETSNSLAAYANSKIAVGGASGYIHLVDGRRKQWIGDVKMNSGVRCIAFSQDNEYELYSAGVDAMVYIWDIRYSNNNGMNNIRCVDKFHNEDGQCIKSIASIGNAICVGSESGVVSCYSRHSHSNSSSNSIETSSPSPYAFAKSFMNLTNTITSVTFHISSQLCAYASNQKRDQLRLIHIPSQTVIQNWPTDRTPLRHVTCLEFNNNSGNTNYLAIGNNVGKVLLYKLNHVF